MAMTTHGSPEAGNAAQGQSSGLRRGITLERAREVLATTRCGFPKRHIGEIVPGIWGGEQRAAWSRLDSVRQRGGIAVMHGPPGVGKTQLATGYAAAWYTHELFKRYGSARYWRLVDLFNAERERFRTNADHSPLADALSCGYLVLDDIQQIARSDYELSQLTNLIDHRYAASRFTVLLTNIMPRELASQVLGAASTDRIRDGGGMIDCTNWPNIRAEKGQA